MSKLMKRFFYLVILIISALACDDGDIDQSSFDFDETVNVCGEYTLYRLSTNGQKEALIVTLTDDQIKLEDGTFTANVSLSGPVTVTDRVFAEKVTSSYFCAAVPPVEPKVKKDWRGVSGKVLVQNEVVYDASGLNIVSYKHTVVLQDVVLESGEDSLVFDDTYLFGVFNTAVN